MQKYAKTKILILFLLFSLLFSNALNFSVMEASAAPSSDSLAYLINDIASQIQDWSHVGYYEPTVDVAIIFGYNDTSGFDLEITSQADSGNWEEVLLLKRASEHAGYSSATIDEKTKWALGNISMFSSYTLPNSTGGYFNCWRRHLLHGYRYAEELDYEIDRWNATDAFLGLKNVRDSEGHPFYKCDADAGTGTTYSERWLEAGLCMDVFFVLYEAGVDDALDYAIAEWEWLNDNRWTGDYFKYVGYAYEWSFSDVGPNVAKLNVYGESLENYSRIVEHIENAYWNESYSSPLWHSTEKVITHSSDNLERRLPGTVNAYTYSHLFYSMMDSGNQTNFENMLEGNGVTALWQALNSSDLRNSSSYQFRLTSSGTYTDEATINALLGFLLAGISPKSGRGLAIPTEADRKHAYSGAINSRHFGFSYATHSIKIPVWADSKLKFLYGSLYPKYTFTEDGIYNVTFSSDWNSISSVTKVSNLYSDVKFAFLDLGGAEEGETHFLFETGSKLEFQNDIDQIVTLEIISGILNSSINKIQFLSDGGSFRFTALNDTKIKITYTLSTVRVQGDQGKEQRVIENGTTITVNTANNVLIQWDIIFEPSLPITFILGMVGLAGMFGGPLYSIHLIKKGKYRSGFIAGVIWVSVGIALFIAWLWG